MLRFSSVSVSFGASAANCKYFLHPIFIFGVIKDFIDAGLSGTESFCSRFALVNYNRTFASSLTGCLYPKLFVDELEHSFFYAQEFDSSKARITNEI